MKLHPQPSTDMEAQNQTDDILLETEPIVQTVQSSLFNNINIDIDLHE